MHDVHVIPFADAATETTDPITLPFHSDGVVRIMVPVKPGWLDYLTRIHVDVDDGTVEHIRLMDTNGAPIVMLSGEMFNLIGNRMPIQLDGSGRGALANMSSHCPYSVEIVGKCQGRLHVFGRALPHPVDGRGVPVKTTPPDMGTMQFWSNILHVQVDKGFNRTTVHRVGNYIKELLFVFQDRQRFCVEELSLQYDLIVYHPDDDEIDIAHTATGVYSVTFPGWPDGLLPTLVRTVLELCYVSPHMGTVHIGVNDVAPPMYLR